MCCSRRRVAIDWGTAASLDIVQELYRAGCGTFSVSAVQHERYRSLLDQGAKGRPRTCRTLGVVAGMEPADAMMKATNVGRVANQQPGGASSRPWRAVMRSKPLTRSMPQRQDEWERVLRRLSSLGFTKRFKISSSGRPCDKCGWLRIGRIRAVANKSAHGCS